MVYFIFDIVQDVLLLGTCRNLKLISTLTPLLDNASSTREEEGRERRERFEKDRKKEMIEKVGSHK